MTAPLNPGSEDEGQTEPASLEIESAAFFTDQLSDGEPMIRGSKMNRLRMIGFPTDQIKARLRKIISKHLVNGMVIPEVVEGLVEFLADVVREDPKKAKLLGVHD